MGIWCRSTSSTRTPRLRRRVSTTWSRRHPNQLSRALPANLCVLSSVRACRKKPVYMRPSCIRTRDFTQARRVSVPGDSVVYVYVHLFLLVFYGGNPVWTIVEAVGKAASRARSTTDSRLHSAVDYVAGTSFPFFGFFWLPIRNTLTS